MARRPICESMGKSIDELAMDYAIAHATIRVDDPAWETAVLQRWEELCRRVGSDYARERIDKARQTMKIMGMIL